ncbi:MAG: Slp family lipoprotein [Thermodesulfobacteriota bacterium]|nr:Slp family lipoprotein [Thermodesulfobacteriota bacterium]
MKAQLGLQKTSELRFFCFRINPASSPGNYNKDDFMGKYIKTNAWHLFFGLIIVGYGLFAFSGCAPIISKQLREQVAKVLNLSVVAKDPEAYRGKTVLWSGTIISSMNLKEGTIIEVLQKPTDMQGKPKDVDDSEGRFLVLYPGYLDVAIYNSGRKGNGGRRGSGKENSASW